MKKKRYQSLVLSQVFLRDRLKALGPDLAAAHFLCHRNCRVRFRGQDHWTQLEADGSLNIPAVYVAGWYIEAIEASTAEIVYEGLQNFRNLEYLKVLNIYVIIVMCHISVYFSGWTCLTVSTLTSGAWTESRESSGTLWSTSTSPAAAPSTGTGWSACGGCGASRPSSSRTWITCRTSAANRSIGEVVQSRRRPLLGPSPG